MYNDSLITGKVIKSGILRSVNHFGSYVNSLVDGPEYNDRTVASLREYNMVDTATANAMEVHSAVINNNVPVVRKNVLARDSYKYKFMSYLGFHNDDSDSLYTAVAFNNFEVSRLLIQEKKFPVNCTIFCNDQISTMVECKTINSVLTVKFPKNIRLDKAGCLSKVSLLTMACENNNSDLVKLCFIKTQIFFVIINRCLLQITSTNTIILCILTIIIMLIF